MKTRKKYKNYVKKYVKKNLQLNHLNTEEENEMLSNTINISNIDENINIDDINDDKSESKSKSKSNKICNKQMSFQECELAIMRHAIDNANIIQGRDKIASDEIKKIIDIVEKFLRKKQLICYGGTAINNILPLEDQFYNKDIEMPDYDFYSTNALNDAKELTEIYVSLNFIEVEAKSGQHHGTYKVFVNFIPIADITYMPIELFKAIKKEAIKVEGILYAPPNLLRMGMYLELSRPAGNTTRWEKVLKRLILLTKHYPLTDNQCDKICSIYAKQIKI